MYLYIIYYYMVNLCQYKDALGVPGQGIHSYRIFGVAIADVIMTIIGAYIYSYIYHTSFLYSLLGLFALGIFLHKLFCVKTSIHQLLFSNDKKMSHLKI